MPQDIIQMQTIILLACEVVEIVLERTGWRMAMYLSKLKAVMVSTEAATETPAKWTKNISQII